MHGLEALDELENEDAAGHGPAREVEVFGFEVGHDLGEGWVGEVDFLVG